MFRPLLLSPLLTRHCRYEIACQLEAAGAKVLLYLVDGRAPIHDAEYLSRDNGMVHWCCWQVAYTCFADAVQLVTMFRGLKHYMGKALYLDYRKLASLTEDKRLFYIMDESIKHQVLPENLPPEVGIAFFTRFRGDFVENEELLRGYKPSRVFQGPVTLFLATEPYRLLGIDDPLLEDPTWGWSQILGPNRVRVVSIEGDHDTIIFPPLAEGLAQRMREAFERDTPAAATSAPTPAS